MALSDLLLEDLVFIDIAPTTQEELFSFLCEELSEAGYIEPTWHEAILNREKTYPTGLLFSSVGLAIPHVDPVHLKKPYIAVVKPQTPITFEHMGATDELLQAEFVFNLGLTQSEKQVDLLQALMALCSDDLAIQKLKSATSASELYNRIKELL